MIATKATVKDLMTSQVIVAHTSHSFTQICRLFFELDIHHLPVLNDQNELIGIISSNDALKVFSFRVPQMDLITEERLNATFNVSDLMTPKPISVDPNTSILQAAKLFDEHNIQSLPVVEGGKMVGILTTKDLIRAMAS